MNSKPVLKIILLLLLPCCIKAQLQPTNLDSLQSVLKNAPDDSVRMVILFDLAGYYVESTPDSCLFFANEGVNIARKINQPLWIAHLLTEYQSFVAMNAGNLPLSFKQANEALKLVQDEANEKNVYIPKDYEFTDPHKFRLSQLGYTIHQIGNIYRNAGNQEKAIMYYKQEIGIFESLESKRAMAMVQSNMNIGAIYGSIDKLDSAIIYDSKALLYSKLTGWQIYNGHILKLIGSVYAKRNMLDSARYYYLQGLLISRQNKNKSSEIEGNIALANLYKKLYHPDSVKHYATVALQQSTDFNLPASISSAASLVSDAWKMEGNADSAFAYLQLSKTVGDSLNKDQNEKIMQFQNINFEEQMRLEKAAHESAAYSNKIRTIALITGLFLLSILAFVFYRNNKQKQVANIVLQQQKGTIENTLHDLQSTQTQLIQSEKMASLGELTAGIAHEIQNPLNFVNNFSEVNQELIEELQGERAKVRSERDEDLEDEIINDIKQNLEKINHHGKRADSIVKGMLQHSRKSEGKKEPTDINALCDEYLRLAYHGLRAKDKSFNTDFKTDFDESLGKINIVSQDIGRVLLNLYNNAFYAVSEKKKSYELSAMSYEPLVSVTTKVSSPSPLERGRGEVIITVKDNGNGIPQNIVDKIFQPFFTTKPTGQGTGLGLSLSYDIIKAHGGEIKVETTLNAEDSGSNRTGTTFTITLPSQA